MEYKLNNRIFQDIPEDLDESWTWGALVGGITKLDNYHIARAYKFVSDDLIERALDRKDLSYETLYPILFNYRQSIEVFIKVLFYGKKTHDLKLFLPELTSLINEKYNIPESNWFTDRIKEISEFDDRTTIFRYDDSENDNLNFESWVDYHYLKYVINEITKIFENIIIR